MNGNDRIVSNRQEELLGENEIMTLTEISRYLRVSKKTVLRMVNAAELPGGKVSNQWRFQKARVEDWLTAKMQGSTREDLIGVMQTRQHLVPLPTLIGEDRIILNIQPGPKKAVLDQLIQPLVETDLLSAPRKFLADLLDREDLTSTAIGDGVAIPHTREQGERKIATDCVVIGLCKDGTDFDAPDGEPTRLFFLVCARSTAAHLRLLAKITLLLRKPGVAAEFRSCTTKEQVMALLVQSHFELSSSF
jgi:PTS system nitrogen regulatory IIA component